MKKLLPLFFTFSVAAAPLAMAATAEDVITTPPDGKEVEYYADFLNYDDIYGFMGDYHSQHTVVFTDDNKVYIPNLLMRKTMPAYIVGTYDEAAKKITVPAGQVVYVSPNIADVTRLYMLDAEGYAGNAETKTYFDTPLTFSVADDGTLTLDTTDQLPMFGIASDEGPEIVYGLGSSLSFVPVASVENKTVYYDYSYVNDADEKTYKTTISGYADDDTMWFRGFDPRYPESWVKATYVGDELRAPAFQVVSYSSQDVPTVMAPSMREINSSGEYEYTHYNFLPITVVDKEAGKFTACTDGKMFITNVCTWGSDLPEVYQAYKKLSLTEMQLSSAVPVNLGYDEDAIFDADALENGREAEFKFYAYAKGTEGEQLLKDALTLRYYVNGEPYVFLKEFYTRQSSDMEMIPYTYADNGAFVLGSDGVKHYTYFLTSQLPDNLETIGVEMYYTMNGVTNVTDRLVYNVKTGKVEQQAGVENVAADEGADVESVSLFDITGRAVGENAKGLVIKLIRYTNGTTRTVKEVVR